MADKEDLHRLKGICMYTGVTACSEGVYHVEKGPFYHVQGGPAEAQAAAARRV